VGSSARLWAGGGSGLARTHPTAPPPSPGRSPDLPSLPMSSQGEGIREGGRAGWASLALLSVAVLLAMSPWFTASAAGELFRDRLGLSGAELAWLTGAVQMGFVAGTLMAAVLNLADLIPARYYFSIAALLAAAANGLLLLPGEYEILLVFRFLTGFFLAAVYPPAMKMAATWFRSARGMAIGTVVGALTVGKAAPFLLRAGGEVATPSVVFGASLAAVAGGLLVFAFYRDGPFPFPRRPFRWDLVGEVARHKATRLATWGYLGHMWELYAVWSAISLYFLDHLVGRGVVPAAAGAGSALLAFLVIAVGGPGAVVAGLAADRWGRERVAGGAMAVSGACCLLAGWILHAPPALVMVVALIWGFSVVADSAQFSALVTEVAPPHAVGTALTLQTALGFALTAVSIWLVHWSYEVLGWGWSWMLLAPGPALGILAMVRLRAMRRREVPVDPSATAF
jgi:MFS family permease